ncbi:histidine kinase [Haladaptatus halobius]|uniref:histidine kinase n=1 Tax=Haladaptatus halobius TaxID=2884875 RepID=UPI001D09F043|nr:histidine kinase [Haladaptatus halobius]
MSGLANTRSNTTGGTAANALLGGVLGGIAGAAAFGVLMWALDPEFLEASIPALYGLEPTTTVGWAIHLLHGVILGVTFAAIVSRDAVARWLTADVETDALARTGLAMRLIAAGFVYGLAIWAILPVIVMPTWLGYVGHARAGVIPAIAVESLVGHVIFGTLLGAVYAAVVTRG